MSEKQNAEQSQEARAAGSELRAPVRLCVFCEHMEFDHEEGGGGGCDTCGWGADEGRNDMTCTKGHWTTDITQGLTAYQEKIQTAETCADYKPPEA